MPGLLPPHVIDSVQKRRQPQTDDRAGLWLPLPTPQNKPPEPEPKSDSGVVVIDYTVDFEIC